MPWLDLFGESFYNNGVLGFGEECFAFAVLQSELETVKNESGRRKGLRRDFSQG